jgi:hypothetical protein
MPGRYFGNLPIAHPRETLEERIARPYDDASTLDKLDWHLAYVMSTWLESAVFDEFAPVIEEMVRTLETARLMIDRLQEERMRTLSAAPKLKWMVFEQTVKEARGVAICDTQDEAVRQANAYISVNELDADDDWVVKSSGAHWQRKVGEGFLFIVSAPEYPVKPIHPTRTIEGYSIAAMSTEEHDRAYPNAQDAVGESSLAKQIRGVEADTRQYGDH